MGALNKEKSLLLQGLSLGIVKLREIPLTALCAAQQQIGRTSPAGCSVGGVGV